MKDDLLARYTTSADADGSNSRNAGIDRRVKDQPAPLMLELRLHGGVRHAFPYSYLNRITYLPSDGVIELEFGGDVVKLEGRRLDELCDALIRHNVRSISQTGRASVASTHDEGPVVTEVVVQRSGSDG